MAEGVKTEGPSWEELPEAASSSHSSKDSSEMRTLFLRILGMSEARRPESG